VAVVPVREAVAATGGLEALAEAGGAGLFVGRGALEAADGASGAGPLRAVELGDFAPGGWAETLAPLVAEAAVVILPASPDGRDLAPRLAHLLGRPLLAGASAVGSSEVVVVRQGGALAETWALDGPAVVTLLPGVRSAPGGGAPRQPERIEPVTTGTGRPGSVSDARLLGVVAADPASMDLSEARRIVAGGAGLGDRSRFALLAEVAAALGAAPGATRVVADAGWVPAHRYIGTTGVTVSPDLYLAVGISGAVQHVTGIRRARHVVAVNTDPSAPMMALADLAVVGDGPGVLASLARLLGVGGSQP